MDIDHYFIENLHLMFNKPNLIRNKSINGHPLVIAFKNKVKPNQEEEVQLVELMLDLLHGLFKEMKGGGITLEQLKEMIREKVKHIHRLKS
jgi:hypothetical protein